MVLPPKIIHPTGELEINLKKREMSALAADTFDGRIHIEWDPQAQVTPLGQLPFFIQYLKVGHLFEPWVDDCPLSYASNNAPKKVNVLGSFLLSILSGHTRGKFQASCRLNVKFYAANRLPRSPWRCEMSESVAC